MSIDLVQFHNTDTGNAERLARAHGEDVRYCFPFKTWYTWDGRRWEPDRTGEVDRLAKRTLRDLYGQASDAGDLATRKWAFRSENAVRLRAMIERCRSEPGIAVLPEELDSDPYLVNCLNGTLDLRTGELREPRRSDLITKICAVEYRPDARLQLWDDFLSTVTDGNSPLADFLQRAAGYSLCGTTTDEHFFFVHGPTATGKSTFLEALKATFGDYAATADFEAFLKRSQVGAPRNDIARLAGTRLVVSIEVDEGKSLAEGLIKMLTGGDKVTARFLYKEAFEFHPTFKLWLAANQRPKVSDSDAALWRRILEVPFTKSIPNARKPRLIAAFWKQSSLCLD